jgi:hypothetical protein
MTILPLFFFLIPPIFFLLIFSSLLFSLLILFFLVWIGCTLLRAAVLAVSRSHELPPGCPELQPRAPTGWASAAWAPTQPAVAHHHLSPFGLPRNRPPPPATPAQAAVDVFFSSRVGRDGKTREW